MERMAGAERIIRGLKALERPETPTLTLVGALMGWNGGA
jgi:hypothetical protein